jgi:hypothetical protein
MTVTATPASSAAGLLLTRRAPKRLSLYTMLACVASHRNAGQNGNPAVSFFFEK